MRQRYLVALVVAVCFSVLLCKRSAHAVIWTADTKGDFTEEPRDEMRFAVKLHYTALGVFGGSGVLLDSTHVLTAKHATDGWSAQQIRVEVAGKRYRVAAIRPHPTSGVDLAVLRLVQAVPPVHSSPIKLVDEKPVPSERVWLGGFGLSGPLGRARAVGQFASGFNRIDKIDGHRGRIRFEAPGEKGCEPQEAFPAIFDSGSPVFVRRKETWVLSGITVTVSNRSDPGHGNISHHELIVFARDWITGCLKDSGPN